MTQNERIKAVRDTIVEIDEVLLRTATRLANLQDSTITDDPVDLPTGKRPLLESGTYSVHWRRRRCYLSRSTSYKLLARLLKRPDRYVFYDHLLQDVWDNRVVSHETIRSAVRLLKFKLAKAGMTQLAKAIRGEGQQYGLFLDRQF